MRFRTFEHEMMLDGCYFFMLMIVIKKLHLQSSLLGLIPFAYTRMLISFWQFADPILSNMYLNIDC
jgi:hypothetical protein